MIKNFPIIRYWSRKRGKYVNPRTGEVIKTSFHPKEDGYTSDPIGWYKGLIETLIDASNGVHERSGEDASWIIASADTLTLLECGETFKPIYHNENIGAPEKVGTLCDKFSLYRDDTLKDNIFVGNDIIYAVIVVDMDR
jgi:hypothetical protein